MYSPEVFNYYLFLFSALTFIPSNMHHYSVMRVYLKLDGVNTFNFLIIYLFLVVSSQVAFESIRILDQILYFKIQCMTLENTPASQTAISQS